MSGIDWEGLLGAEGDELQDAYDAAVDEWNGWDEDPDEEEWERREALRARRRIFLCQSGDKEERKAIREALEARLHTKFLWLCPVGMDGKPERDRLALLEMVEDRPRRVVMTDGMGRIVVLDRQQSEKFLNWGETDRDYIAEPQNPFRLPDVDFLKQQYDEDGMPVRVSGRYYKVYDDGYYREEHEVNDYTVWCRSEYQEENLTWVFERVCPEGGPLSLRPAELWTNDYGSPRMIWRARL